MDFIIKMEEAMKLLAEACSMNEDWINCQYCPFSRYCDLFEEAGYDVISEELSSYMDK